MRRLPIFISGRRRTSFYEIGGIGPGDTINLTNEQSLQKIESVLGAYDYNTNSLGDNSYEYKNGKVGERYCFEDGVLYLYKNRIMGLEIQSFDIATALGLTNKHNMDTVTSLYGPPHYKKLLKNERVHDIILYRWFNSNRTKSLTVSAFEDGKTTYFQKLFTETF